MTTRNRRTRPTTGAALALLVALAACRSTDADLGIDPQPAVSMPSAAASIVPAGGSVQFLPLVGVPPDKAAALSQALAGAAASSGIAILPASAPSAPLRLKGYFSALEEGQETLVVFVWDIVDPAGTRVNRLQGQVRAPATAGDPWSAVGPEVMKAVADQTMAALAGAGVAPNLPHRT